MGTRTESRGHQRPPIAGPGPLTYLACSSPGQTSDRIPCCSRAKPSPGSGIQTLTKKGRQAGRQAGPALSLSSTHPCQSERLCRPQLSGLGEKRALAIFSRRQGGGPCNRSPAQRWACNPFGLPEALNKQAWIAPAGRAQRNGAAAAAARQMLQRHKGLVFSILKMLRSAVVWAALH